MFEHPITKLTSEQEALIPIYQDKWRKIALSTERIDRQKAADAVKVAYKLIGHEEQEPEIVFCDSPYSALKEWENLPSDKELPRCKLLLNRPCPLLEYPNMKLHDHDKFRGKLEEGFWRGIGDLRKLIYVEMEGKLEELGLYSFPDLFIEEEEQIDCWLYPCLYSDFCISILELRHISTKWEVLKNIVEHCGWIFAYKKICLICDRVATPQEYRPTLLSFDNQNRLHALGEPAIEYADGFKVYAHHGVWRPQA